MNLNDYQRPTAIILWITVAGLVLSLLVWLHLRFVVAPLEYANRDFMSLWTGGRAVLLDLDPYSLAVWRPLREAYGSTWMPDPRAPFPLWTFLFTAPLALFSLHTASAIWLALSETFLAVALYLMVGRIYGYRPSLLDLALLVVVAYGSILTYKVLDTGQMTFLLVAVLAGYLFLIHQSRPFWGGVLLSLIALKPNPFILFAPLIGLYWLRHGRWPELGGPITGGVSLLAASWLVQPDWLTGWFTVRSKTIAMHITPTLWGLAFELTPKFWLPLGLFFTILVTSAVGYYLFTREELPEPVAVSLALTASLLTTPYAWSYEHALLIVPWLWLFLCRKRAVGRILWLTLAWLVPWLFAWWATVRQQETYSMFLPLVTGVAVLWLYEYFKGRSVEATLRLSADQQKGVMVRTRRS